MQKSEQNVVEAVANSIFVQLLTTKAKQHDRHRI
jgi:hypothetical protein